MDKDDTLMKDTSYKTAIKRKAPSRPLKYLLKNRLLHKKDKIFDYGSGRGDDALFLRCNGFNVHKWDPHWYPNSKSLHKSYDVVLCTYVLNVVGVSTRKQIITELKSLTGSNGKVYITVRRDLANNHIISKIGTHQYMVHLPFKILYENSSYCIYEVNN